jgi:hypothetical protein
MNMIMTENPVLLSGSFVDKLHDFEDTLKTTVQPKYEQIKTEWDFIDLKQIESMIAMLDTVLKYGNALEKILIEESVKSKGICIIIQILI